MTFARHTMSNPTSPTLTLCLLSRSQRKKSLSSRLKRSLFRQVRPSSSMTYLLGRASGQKRTFGLCTTSKPTSSIRRWWKHSTEERTTCLSSQHCSPLSLQPSSSFLPLLQADPTQATLDALTTISAQIAAQNDVGHTPTPPYQGGDTSPTPSAVSINALWILSLFLSLSTLVLAMLVK